MKILLLIVLILTLPCAAQLEPFEEALRQGRLTRAGELLRTIKDPHTRLLAEAELRLAEERPDLSFPLTDQLEGVKLPPELLGKYLFIKGSQEVKRPSDNPDVQELVMRFVREGLRHNPPPHDRRSLLLYRISWAKLDQLAIAEQDVLELGELSIAWGLEGKALLAQSRGEDREATLLWRTLFDRAKQEGDLASAVRYGLYLQRMLKTEAEAWELLDSLVALGAQAGEPHLSVRVAARRMRLAYEVGKKEEAEQILTSTLAQLRGPDLQARLVNSYLMTIHGQSREWAERGIALGKEMGDPVVEAAFVQGLSQRARDEEWKTLSARVRQLLAGRDLRGVRRAWFLLTVPSAPPGPQPADDLEKFRSQLAASESSQFRYSLYRRSLENDVLREYPPPVRLAYEVMDAFSQELARSPFQDFDADHSDTFSLDWTEKNQNSESAAFRPGDLVWGQSLVHYWQSKHPEVVERVLDARLVKVYEAKKDFYRAEELTELAGFLSFLGRNREALHLLEGASALLAGEPSSFLTTKLNETRAHTLIKQGRALEGAQLLAGPVWQKQSDNAYAWRLAARIAWVYFAAERDREAIEWAQKATELFPPEDEKGALVFAGVPSVLVQATARLQGPEEALLRLEPFIQAEKKEPFPRLSELLLLKAELLALSGRVQEIDQALAEVDKGYNTPVSLYRTVARHRIAKLSKNPDAVGELDGQIADLVQKITEEAGDPVLLHYLFQKPEYRSLGLKPPALATAPQENSFGSLVERLEALRRREPDNQDLQRLSAGDLRTLQAEAGEGELFIQPIILPHSVLFICLSREQSLVLESFCDAKGLQDSALRLAGLTAGKSESSALESERQKVFQGLVEPWRERFPDHKRVYWMDQGNLRHLPLSMLMEDAVLTHLDGPGRQTLETGASRSALLVGGASDLSGATTELEGVRKLYPQGTQWSVGEDLGRLRQLAPQHNLVHIATHGVAPSEERLGGQVLGSRGSLGAFQLTDLRFPADTLAVVSACQGALGFGEGHDNASLLSALRTAGAEVVVGSLWGIDDAVGTELFLEFYRELEKDSDPAAALARAQQTLKSRHPHPYYWAGVRVVSGP